MLNILGKGELHLSVGGTPCIDRGNSLETQETFAITGGSGIYVSASGGGTYTDESGGPPKWGAKDTWTGTLTVPGLEFDLTAPVLNGAHNRNIRAGRGMRRIRVPIRSPPPTRWMAQFRWPARRGRVAWFAIGRTRVRCSATDGSGNQSNATFSVTVKRSRNRA